MIRLASASDFSSGCLTWFGICPAWFFHHWLCYQWASAGHHGPRHWSYRPGYENIAYITMYFGHKLIAIFMWIGCRRKVRMTWSGVRKKCWCGWPEDRWKIKVYNKELKPRTKKDDTGFSGLSCRRYVIAARWTNRSLDHELTYFCRMHSQKQATREQRRGGLARGQAIACHRRSLKKQGKLIKLWISIYASLMMLF